MRAILCLEALGYYASNCKGKQCNHPDPFECFGRITKYEMSFDNVPRNERINRIADEIEVNDILIDNRLSEGDVTCYLKLRGDRETETDNDNDVSRGDREAKTDNDIYCKLSRLVPRTILILRSIPSLLWSIARAQTPAFANRDGHIYLKPQKAVEKFVA